MTPNPDGASKFVEVVRKHLNAERERIGVGAKNAVTEKLSELLVEACAIQAKQNVAPIVERERAYEDGASKLRERLAALSKEWLENCSDHRGEQIISLTELIVAQRHEAAADLHAAQPQFPLHDILLLLGYMPGPDECIGQATIHKALAEHDAALVAPYRSDIAHLEIDIGRLKETIRNCHSLMERLEADNRILQHHAEAQIASAEVKLVEAARNRAVLICDLFPESAVARAIKANIEHDLAPEMFTDIYRNGAEQQAEAKEEA